MGFMRKQAGRPGPSHRDGVTRMNLAAHRTRACGDLQAHRKSRRQAELRARVRMAGTSPQGEPRFPPTLA